MQKVASRPRRPHGTVVRSLAGVLALAILATAAEGQVLRGTVRTLDTSLPIPSAEIIVRDSVGGEVARAYSNEAGAFTIRLRQRIAFSVHARRVGFQMADTDLLRVTEDTVNIGFQLAEVATDLDAVNVTGMAALNAERLAEAQRRGWNVYQPEVVAQHRSRARDLTELLRSLGPRNVQMPRHPRDCVRSMRTNKCVTYVLDGQVLGTEAYILPEDIYFLAVLTPSESAVMYGNRAIDGAIVVYTRMNGDQYDQDRLPPHLRRAESRTPDPATKVAPRRPPPSPPPGAGTPRI